MHNKIYDIKLNRLRLRFKLLCLFLILVLLRVVSVFYYCFPCVFLPSISLCNACRLCSLL